jgi:uncharacterized membrane protein YozB (DUF420 family)
MVQIVLLILVCVGALQARRRDWNTHRWWMTVAVIIQATVIVFVMNPSFFRALPSTWGNSEDTRLIVMWPHMVLGVMAELLGVYIVLRSQMDSPTTPWPSKKRMMQATLVLWLVALLGGMALYVVWYV